MQQEIPHDPKLDLVLTRVVNAPREKLYAGWTNAEMLKQWFVPKPWTIAEAQLDVRPGGGNFIVMKSPEGQEMPMRGCYLEVVPNERIVFTDALLGGFRPSGQAFFTGIITFESVPGGTRYTAVAKHANEEDRKKHEEMGFHEGWGKCLAQLVELVNRK